MNSLIHDLRYALRQLRKSPGFVITAVLTLALGIGANTAIFSVVNALMLRPLPYPQPTRMGELITHWTGSKSSEDDNSANGDTFLLVRDQVPAVQAAAYGLESGVNMQAGSSVQYVQQLRVSSKYFDVLGIPPRMGRGFNADEDSPNGPAVVVLSNALWRTTFHSDPHIVGKGILLKGAPYTVVGVLAPKAQSPLDEQTSDAVDVWTPLRPSRTGEGGGTNYGVLLRLKPGATWAQADAQLSRVMPEYFRHVLARNLGTSVHLEGIPLQKSEAMPVRASVFGLMLAVGFVLLIACANLAGLALVRAGRRSGEMATRMALGASGLALVRQLWTENMVLALLGGAAGLGFAKVSLVFLQHLIPLGLLPTDKFSLDGRVLLFTLAVSLLTSILFGMLPALELRRIDLRSAMAAGTNRAFASSGNARMRTFLIAGEIALTVVLVAASGLLIRSLIYLETLPPGFDATNVMTGKVSLDDAHYHDPAAFQHLLTSSIDAMRRIPGVENAAVGLSLPYERGLNDGVKLADGKNAGKEFGSDEIYITPGYFDVLRMHLLAGRQFTDSDTAQSQPVVIVNEAFARKYLEQTNPVGRHLQSGEHSRNGIAVVGVVADVMKTPGLDRRAPLTSEPTVYVPATQIDADFLSMAHVWFEPSWIVRTRGPVTGITAAMQAALSQADPSLPFSGFYSMADLEKQALSFQRIEVILLGVLAGLALLLSAIGVYGLIANLVVQRTREIGIRLALGSTTRQAMQEIGRSGVVATVLGLGVGLAASLGLLRVLQSVIYGVGTYDPVTLVGTSLVLAAVAMAATFLPTCRIARIDPAKILREE
ncbi:MAG TPA: ABC transporter permease [Acidobacteriaceae bacterium]|jgi:predicted permease|nr:ABC transporter permease [Acidobacteriaceae bacterium]